MCGKLFSVEHALCCPLCCPCGGLPIVRHNELRDITAGLLAELCHSVEVEPSLQPFSGESFQYRSANVEDGARLDVVANGFWERGQKAYFDVKVFNPFAPTHCSVSLPQCYRRAELEKKRKYEERIREVEHGTFSPLVFSCTGGMGPLATVVYKRIATLLSEKNGQSYSMTLHWLRCKLSFSLLCAAITCLRGSRFSYHRFSFKESAAIDLVCAEGRISSFD